MTNDLIRRESVKAVLFGTVCGADVVHPPFPSDIDAIPAVDAVEVVFCKNCIYQKDATVNCKGFIICPVSNMEITDDDYCSYGERREGEASE